MEGEKGRGAFYPPQGVGEGIEWGYGRGRGRNRGKGKLKRVKGIFRGRVEKIEKGETAKVQLKSDSD